MNASEQNTQRIMTELLAARARIKELEAELANKPCDLYYTEMIASFQRERTDTRAVLHNLVEACYQADNAGELASEIDGSLMDEAWRVLKNE